MASDYEIQVYKACNLPAKYYDARIQDQPWEELDIQNLREFCLTRAYSGGTGMQHIALLHENSTSAYSAAVDAHYILARSFNLDGTTSYITSMADLSNAVIGEWMSEVNDCQINYYFVDDFIFCEKENIDTSKLHAFLRRCAANNQALCFLLDNDIWSEETWPWPRYIWGDIVDNLVVMPLHSKKELTPNTFGE